MKRADDFETRRVDLANLTDEQLQEYFWTLTAEVVDPLIELGRNNTTPSIERSVLLRMGFSSLEAKPIVNGCIENNLIGYGAGNVVYRLSKANNTTIREAGLSLLKDGFAQAVELFEGVE